MQDLIPFEEFKKSLHEKSGRKKFALQENIKASASQIGRMRRFLVDFYDKATAVHSFVEDGQIWDCMPIETQPSLKDIDGGQIKDIPPFPGTPDQSNRLFLKQYQGSDAETKSLANNNIGCPAGSVPVRRMHLEELVTYKTLSSYHQKQTRAASTESASKKRVIDEMVDAEHQYVVASQVVGNEGAGGVLNLWAPALSSSAHFFSLAQLWLVGGDNGNKQTIEVGWQVCPRLWGHNKPVLFIYWSTDNYANGGYNLERKKFIQTSHEWRLGGALNPVSAVDGDQYEIRVNWLFRNDAWWLYLNERAVGYYPSAVFGNGVLANQAQVVIAGGEVSGDQTWPFMGSGLPAQEGYRRAAYIRNITYAAFDGSDRPLALTPKVTAPNCFGFFSQPSDSWQSSFFYGGRGGPGC